jgi:predicted small lipoprotein YifL
MRAIAVTLLAALALALAGCGRVGPPRPPGPVDQITYPRLYPAPTAEERVEINARRAAQGLPPLPSPR